MKAKNWYAVKICILCLSLYPSFSFSQNVSITKKESELKQYYDSGITAKEVNRKLYHLTQKSNNVLIERIGYSEKDQPIYKVTISQKRKQTSHEKVKLLITAGQHGDEPSGTLALLQFIDDYVNGKYSDYIDNIDLVIIPLVNPDGWDKHTRENESGANINADYVALNTPEARAVVSVLNSYSPDFVLDIHESSTYKTVLTGLQGYLTDVESQFEAGNNANSPQALTEFANNDFLPAVIKDVFNQGGNAQLYQGAIVRLEQPLTGARANISTLRNYASLHNAISILLESKKDYQERNFSTPGNIKNRVKKQGIALTSVLKQISLKYLNIIELTTHRVNLSDPIIADIGYSLDKDIPYKNIPLINVKTGVKEIHQFPNWSKVEIERTYVKPTAYAITENEAGLSKWLKMHGIKLKEAGESAWLATSLRLVDKQEYKEKGIGTRVKTLLSFEEGSVVLNLNNNNLVVLLDQPLGELASLLLDPRSDYGWYQSQPQKSKLNESASIIPLIEMK